MQAGSLQSDMQAATEAFWQLMQVQAAVVEDLQKQNEDVAKGACPSPPESASTAPQLTPTVPQTAPTEQPPDRPISQVVPRFKTTRTRECRFNVHLIALPSVGLGSYSTRHDSEWPACASLNNLLLLLHGEPCHRLEFGNFLSEEVICAIMLIGAVPSIGFVCGGFWVGHVNQGCTYRMQIITV